METKYYDIGLNPFLPGPGEDHTECGRGRGALHPDRLGSA